MTVIILTEYFPDYAETILTGGVESRVFHLVEFLKKKHAVLVVRRTERYEFNSLLTSLKRMFFFLSTLKRIIVGPERADIVEGTNFLTHVLAFLWAKRVGARAVAWYPDVFLGTAIEQLGMLSGLLVELEERVTLKLPWDGVIALSKQTERKLRAQRINTDTIQVIYGGVERGKVKGQKFSQPTILCIARLVAYKRIRDFILSAYLLRETFPTLQVLIVGDGPEKRTLQRITTQLHLTGKITWKERVSETEKNTLFSSAWVHVLPSVVEGLGLVTIESLAAGTPVVNADIPISREILREQTFVPRNQSRGRAEEGKTQFRGGLLFRPGDPVDLTDKIELLLTDKKLYNQKVQEGMELVKRYEWKKVNKQTEGFYQRLLSN